MFLRSLDSFHSWLEFLGRCFVVLFLFLHGNINVDVCVIFPSSFMENCAHIYTHIYRLCHAVLSVRSFNNAQQFSSFLDLLPRFHLRRISALFERRFHLSATVSLDLFLCVPLFLRVCSSIHDVYAHAYVRVCPCFRRIYRCILPNVSFAFFLGFSIFYSRCGILL